MIRVCQGDIGDNRAPNGQSWNNLRNKIKYTVLECNPNYKINIHESTLIYRIEEINKWE